MLVHFVCYVNYYEGKKHFLAITNVKCDDFLLFTILFKWCCAFFCANKFTECFCTTVCLEIWITTVLIMRKFSLTYAVTSAELSWWFFCHLNDTNKFFKSFFAFQRNLLLNKCLFVFLMHIFIEWTYDKWVNINIFFRAQLKYFI